MFRLLDRRWLTFWTCLSALIATAGCNESPGVSPPQTKSALVSDDELHRRIHEQVIFNRDNRILDSSVNNAWQVVHGLLAYGRSFPIRVNGKVVPCLEWVLGGGDLKGWGLQPGDRGVASTIIEGKVGAGHPDQWLGYLSQNGLKIDDVVVVDGRKFTVKDMLEQAKFDVFDGKELPWVLMATSTYLPIDATWPARDGNTWSSERIAEMEAKRALGTGACGDTHKLYALAVSVKREMRDNHLAPDQLTAGWKLAYQQVQETIGLAQQYQQPDGTLSTKFFERAGTDADWGKRIYSTGHTLEYLVAAMNDEQFASATSPTSKNPWLARAALALTKILEHHQTDDIECGALYHAAHGLLLFDQRRWGDTFDATTESPKAAAPRAEAAPPIVSPNAAPKPALSADGDAPPAAPSDAPPVAP